MKALPCQINRTARPGPAASVTEIVVRTRRAMRRDVVSVRDVVTALGRASFAPLLLLPALIVVTPASGIPLLSSICGLTISLVALQMLLGRDHVWLPRWLLRRRAPAKRLTQALDWITPAARWLDRVTKRRLDVLVSPPVLRMIQALCVLCGAVMPALELVPFTSSMLGLTVSLLAIGMVTRDGLFALAGLAIIGATILTGHAILT